MHNRDVEHRGEHHHNKQVACSEESREWLLQAGKQNDVFKLISREVESLGFFGREGTCRSKDSVCVTKSARTFFQEKQ